MNQMILTMTMRIMILAIDSTIVILMNKAVNQPRDNHTMLASATTHTCIYLIKLKLRAADHHDDFEADQFNDDDDVDHHYDYNCEDDDCDDDDDDDDVDHDFDDDDCDDDDDDVDHDFDDDDDDDDDDDSMAGWQVELRPTSVAAERGQNDTDRSIWQNH